MTDKERNMQASLRMQAWVEELAKNWREGDATLLQVQCTGIERAIPPESTHEDAKKALEYCRRARQFGDTEKGFLFLMKAESARKDFELYDDAIKGEKFNKPGRGAGLFRKIITGLLKKNPAMKNPELWAVVANKPPKGWSPFDNRQGKYLEGRTIDDHIGQRRFFTICGEERKKLKQ